MKIVFCETFDSMATYFVTSADVYLQLDQELFYYYEVYYESKYFGKQTLREYSWRTITSPANVYDIMNHSHTGEQQKPCDVCSRSSFVHTMEILSRLQSRDVFKSLLIEVDKTEFPGKLLTNSFQCYFKDWLKGQLSSKNGGEVTQEQQLHLLIKNAFLSILLAKINHASNTPINPLCFSEDSLHKLSYSLSQCSSEMFPSRTQGEVEAICTWLAKGLKQNWIYLWHFSNILSAESLIKIRHHVDIPDFSQANLDEAKGQLLSALSHLQDKINHSVKLIICSIKALPDIDCLESILQLITIDEFQAIAEDSDVDYEAAEKLKSFFQDKQKQKDLNLLTKVWQSVVRLNMNRVTSVSRNLLLRYLEDAKWSPVDENIHTLLLDARFFDSTERFLQIMTILLQMESTCSSLYSSQRLFIKLMQEPFVLNLLDAKELKDLVERGIQSISHSCRCQEKHLEAQIQISLQLQHAIHTSDHFKRVESLQTRANESLQKLWKHIPMDRVLQFLCKCNTEGWSDSELTFFTDHIKNRLGREHKEFETNSKVFAQSLRNVEGKTKVTDYSRSVTIIFETIADIVFEKIFLGMKCDSIHKAKGIEEQFPNFEDNILHATQYCVFLIMLMEASYCQTYRYHDQSKLEALTLLLKHVIERVRKGSITLAFVDELVKIKNDVFNMIHASRISGQQDKIRSEWISMCQEAEKQKRAFLQHHESLRKLTEGKLTYICNLAQVTDARDVCDEVTKRVLDLESLEKFQLSRTNDPEYWGCLYSLKESANDLSDFAYSVMFLNVSRSFFEKSIPDLEYLLALKRQTSTTKAADDEEHRHGLYSDFGESVIKPMQYQKFVELLKEHCLSAYQKYGLVVADCNLDIPVEIISNLVEGVDYENYKEDLDKELSLLSNTCRKAIPDEMKSVMESLIKLPRLSQRAKQLESVCKTFDLTEDTSETHKALDTIIQLSETETNGRLSVRTIHEAALRVDEIENKFTELEWSIVEELTSCKELVGFLRRIIDEDLRNLIDAVEERSDQNVNEYTVSALIDVKRYMTPLLLLDTSKGVDDMIVAVSKNIPEDSQTAERINIKINACLHNVHGLQDLFNNCANRGDMTKAQIRNSIERGTFVFEMNSEDEKCRAQMSYERDGKHVIYGLEELKDLKSRALLIASSKAKAQEGRPGISSFKSVHIEDTFIKLVDMVENIVQICKSLIDSGHFDFRTYRTSGSDLKSLTVIHDYLKQNSEEWQQELGDARQKFYFLNFFQSKQLGLLDHFFSRKCQMTDDLTLLFQFVNPHIMIDESCLIYDKATIDASPKNRLLQLGRVMDQLFKDNTSLIRKIPCLKQTSKLARDQMVIPGEVFVAELDIGSDKVINVLLSLYLHTSGYLPEPSQVVFCHPNTPWEEVFLLLERCKGAFSKFPEINTLYAIVNVDRLSTATQFKLVKEVKEMHRYNDRFLLAIICCGGHYHHIIDKFSPSYTHRLPGLSDVELQACFREGWPEVHTKSTAYSPKDSRVDSMTFLTSTQPGLGKSEYVKHTASLIEHGVCTMVVGGSISKNWLIKQLKRLSTRKHCILHIDVSHTFEPHILDSFVFEIVVVGMAVSGTLICKSPSSVVILEVANTIGDTLRNSLSISRAFSRKHIEWAGFDKFVVSDDINSPVQVVCHYLNALQDKTLDTTDILLVGAGKRRPLSTSRCQAILQAQFPSQEGLSFTTIETFLGLFAQELRQMSACMYFHTTNIGKIVEGKYKGKLRTHFAHKLLEVSKQFSLPSVKFFAGSRTVSRRNVSTFGSSGVSADSMVARMKDMVLWNDSNHLFLVFHRQDSQSVTPIYKDIEKVPPDIRNLFETQMSKHQSFLDSRMSHKYLQEQLEKICRKTNAPFDVSKLQDLQTSYALTPDNFLKMILIYLRIQSHIPVIIMGETGCGKTTLVTYLARVCEVPFYKLNLHAGVTEEMIVKFIGDLELKAKGSQQEKFGYFWMKSTHVIILGYLMR